MQRISKPFHMIVFGTPISPEINPIEILFSIWKRLVEELTEEPPSDTRLLVILQTIWLNLDRQHFRSCVGHVVDVVYPKVLDMEDIFGALNSPEINPIEYFSQYGSGQ